MEFVIIPLVALIASGLTFFSGFGLGTLLLPAFAIFFPVELAVAMTAIVHLANNLFKLALVGRHATMSVVLRFGVPAVVAALVGAALLTRLGEAQPIMTYQIAGRECSITWIRIIIGGLIAAFGLWDLIPATSRMQVDRKYLPVGGALSGFFGGLSGHQGALRSMFLIRLGLTKEAFIATGVVVACIVDVARLGVYGSHFAGCGVGDEFPLVAVGAVAAFAGAFIGRRMLRKVTLRSVELFVAVLLIAIGLGMAAGLV